MEKAKTLVITGGTSGIGKATVVSLLSEGWHIYLLARNRKQAESLQNGVGGENLTYIPCDLLSPSSIRNAIDQIEKHLSHIDVFMNHAPALFINTSTRP